MSAISHLTFERKRRLCERFPFSLFQVAPDTCAPNYHTKKLLNFGADLFGDKFLAGVFL